MATSVGHALLGLTVASGACGGRVCNRWLWYAFAVFAANAPDLDHLPGLLMNEPARYHRLATHSLLGLFVFAGIVFIAARWVTNQPLRATVVGAIAYGSHLALDMPWIPWLWPLSLDFVPIAWAPIAADIHASPGADALTLLGELFSVRNLMEIPKELAAYTPLLLATWWLFRRRPRPLSSSGPVGGPIRWPIVNRVLTMRRWAN